MLILKLTYDKENSEKLREFLNNICAAKKYTEAQSGDFNVLSIEFIDEFSLYQWSVQWGAWFRFEQIVTPF